MKTRMKQMFSIDETEGDKIEAFLCCKKWYNVEACETILKMHLRMRSSKVNSENWIVVIIGNQLIIT